MVRREGHLRLRLLPVLVSVGGVLVDGLPLWQGVHAQSEPDTCRRTSEGWCRG